MRPSPLFSRLLRSLIVLTLLFSFSAALYEDEAGKHDWYYRGIGLVNFGAFQVTQQHKRLFVASQQGVVASLSTTSNNTNDEIVWRQVLPEDSTVVSCIKKAPKSLSCVTESFVYTWDNEGNLLWDAPVTQALGIDAVQQQDGKVTHVVTLTTKSVEIRAIEDGKLVTSIDALFGAGKIHVHENKVFVFGKSGIQIIDANNKWTAKTTNTKGFPTTGSIYKAAGGFAAVFSGKSLAFFSLADINESLPTTTLESNIKDVVLSTAGRALVLLKTGQAVAMDGSMQQQPVALEKSATTTAVACYSDTKGSVFGLALSTGKISIIDATSLKQTATLEGSKTSTQVASLFIQTTGTDVFVLVVNQDWTLSLLQSASKTAIWTRPEALASIRQALFVDLPPAIHDGLVGDDISAIGAFIARVKNQLVELWEILEWLQDINEVKQYVLEALHLTRPNPSHSNVKDQFGFRQSVVVITKANVAAAFNTETGRTMWSTYLGGEVSEMKRIFLVRKSVTRTPECTILATSEKTGKGLLVTIDPITGKELSKIDLEFSPIQVLQLPYKDSHSRNPLLVIDAAHNVMVYPPTSEMRSLVQKNAQYVSYFLATHQNGQLAGYRVTSKADNTFVGVESWKLTTGAHLDAIAPALINSMSPGRVTGEKTILFKHLNPNLIAVAGTKTGEKSGTCVVIYLVDAVTGNIIHRTTHKEARGPVRITQAENWIVYHFWNEKLHRFEVAVIELFEKKAPEVSDTNIDSYAIDINNVQVSQQSYVLLADCLVIRTTETSKGITEKTVLFGLANGQILGMSRKLLDPRRPDPNAVTPSDQAEGLYPYNPYLPIHPQALINYNHTVSRIKSIITTPSYLESTSLMFSHGLDIFYSATAPGNKRYDRLSHDFNRVIIIVMTVGLALAALISKRFASRRELTRAWK